MVIHVWLGGGVGKGVGCVRNTENMRPDLKDWYSCGGILSKPESGNVQMAWNSMASE